MAWGLVGQERKRKTASAKVDGEGGGSWEREGIVGQRMGVVTKKTRPYGSVMGTIVIQEREPGCSSGRKDCDGTSNYEYVDEQVRDGRGVSEMEWWNGVG